MLNLVGGIIKKRSDSGSLVSLVLFSTQPLLLNAISVPVMALIIRKLGPTNYGEWTAANSLIMALAPLTNPGLRAHYVRAISSDPSTADSLTADQIGMRLALGLIATTLAVLLAIFLRYPAVAVACTAIAGVGMMLNAVTSTAMDLFQASGRLSSVAGIAMVSGLVLTIGSAITVFQGGGPVGLAISYLLSPLVWVAVIPFVGGRQFPLTVHWNVRRFWGHLKNSRSFAAQQLVASLGQNAEALVAPALIGMNRYGLLSAGTLIVSRLMAIPDGLATAMYPIVSANKSLGAAEASQDIRPFTTLCLAFCLPLSVLCQFIADPIANILLPDDPSYCRLAIQITAWSLPLVGLDMIMGYSLNAIGMTSLQTRLMIMSGFISFGVSMLLIYNFELIGAAATYLTRPLISATVRSAGYQKVFGGLMTGVPYRRIILGTAFLWAGLQWVDARTSASLASGGWAFLSTSWSKMAARLIVDSAASLPMFLLPAAAMGIFANLNMARRAKIDKKRVLIG